MCPDDDRSDDDRDDDAAALASADSSSSVSQQQEQKQQHQQACTSHADCSQHDDVDDSARAATARNSATYCRSRGPHKRRIVEFCCGEDSRIGRLAPEDCDVIRLTIDDDVTTPAGLAKAIAAVSVPGLPTLLFGSMPCIGGSVLQQTNWGRGEATRSRIREHRRKFRLIWRNFAKVAAACRANGGRIAIEWPRRCEYWRWPSIQRFLKVYDLAPFVFDGCRYGLRSTIRKTYGRLLKKPWRIDADIPQFQRLCRRCNHHPEDHVPIQSADTKPTESYTDSLVKVLHSAWRDWVVTYGTMDHDGER
jgi:hypothetical protein